MGTAFVDDEVTSPFARAFAVLDDFAATDLVLVARDDLLAGWRELERLRNRLAAAEHRLIAEVEARYLPSEYGAKNTAAFVRGLLRVDPYEASARVRAAEAAASRTTLTGEPQPAPYVHVAAAQASGDISPKHASTIVAAVERLTPDLQAEHGVQVERDLVQLAGQFDPSELGKLGVRMTQLIDQDGALDESKRRERNRGLAVHQRPDGSAGSPGRVDVWLPTGRMSGEPLPSQGDCSSLPSATSSTLTMTQGMDGQASELRRARSSSPTKSRTIRSSVPTQRNHDPQRPATTGHGAIIALPDANRLATDARLMTVTTNTDGAVVNWTDALRLHTKNQRLAMTVRDRGCIFPTCDAPPAWCQAAHITDHAKGGPTTVCDGALLCGHHHRTYEQQGWQLIALDGVPAWIPPPWIDPDQKPIRNHLHRPDR